MSDSGSNGHGRWSAGRAEGAFEPQRGPERAGGASPSGQGTASNGPESHAEALTGSVACPADREASGGAQRAAQPEVPAGSVPLIVSMRNALAAAERECKKAVAMERLAARHATACDAAVAEADARLAQREADVARLEAKLAEQRLELFDCRNTDAYERGVAEGRRQATEGLKREWGVASPERRWPLSFDADEESAREHAARREGRTVVSRLAGPWEPAEQAQSADIEVFRSRSAGWVFRCHVHDITSSGLDEVGARQREADHLALEHAEQAEDGAR